MNRMRGIFAASWLALALVLGQQAAQLHDVGHAIQRIQTDSHDQHPGSDLDLLPAAIITSFSAFLPAQSRTVVASRSRAPPSAV